MEGNVRDDPAPHRRPLHKNTEALGEATCPKTGDSSQPRVQAWRSLPAPQPAGCLHEGQSGFFQTPNECLEAARDFCDQFCPEASGRGALPLCCAPPQSEEPTAPWGCAHSEPAAPSCPTFKFWGCQNDPKPPLPQWSPRRGSHCWRPTPAQGKVESGVCLWRDRGHAG